MSLKFSLGNLEMLCSYYSSRMIFAFISLRGAIYLVLSDRGFHPKAAHSSTTVLKTLAL